MELWFPIVFTLLVLVIGGVVAIAWWRIAAKAAPYADEAKRTGAPARDDDVVIVKLDTPSQGHDGPR
jgi:hypothetical protein